MNSNEIVLIGRILSVRRTPENPIKNALDASIVVEDLLRGKLRSTYFNNLDVIYNFDDDRKKAYKTIFRKDSLCYLSGFLKKVRSKNVFIVNDFIGTNKAAIDMIRQNLNEDPNSLRSKTIEAGGFSLASRVDKLHSPELAKAEIRSLQQWFVEHNLPYDLDTAWSVHTFFQNRAKHRSRKDGIQLSVLGLLKKNPLMLSDFSPELSVAKLKKVFSTTKDIELTPQMEIYAKISETLFRAAKRGHCCLPLKNLSFYVGNLLDQLGIDKRERNHKLAEMIGEVSDYKAADVILDWRHFEPILPSIKEYFHSRTKDAENLSAEELKDYNRNRIIPTWQIDSLRTFAFLPKLFYGEKYLAKAILDHVTGSIAPITANDSYFETLNSAQRQAVENALKYPISVIIGGAGTGKTYVIQQISKIARSAGHQAPILAPTATAAANAGRGSKDEEYFTIHRYAKISPTDDDLGTSYEISNASETINDGSFVIIDEMSMCTLPILMKMFKTIEGKKVHIVLVGDDKQLPAVGANVFQAFADQLFGKDIPVTRLTENRRSAGNLVEFTQKIRNGVFDVPECDEIKVFPYSAKKYFSKVDLSDFDNMLVLVATRSDQLRMNDILRPLVKRATDRIIVSENDKDSEINTAFYVGDPVVANRNDYADPDLTNSDDEQLKLFVTKEYHHPNRLTNIYNGTFGRIESFNEKANTVFIRLFPPEAPTEGYLLPYYSEELPMLFDVAYAVTTHKAQGGERDTVIFVADNSSQKERSIRRSMLYTASTRAKRQLVFIGKEEFFKEAATKEEEDFLCLLPFRYMMEKDFASTSSDFVQKEISDSTVKKAWKPKRSLISKNNVGNMVFALE